MRTSINCDMGEGIGNDELLMPFIDAANIACGYHAGDAATIQQTIELCLQYNVNIGAHPSFYDRENFGRTKMQLSDIDLYELIIQQLFLFKEIANLNGATMHHVKPHGALYNCSAIDTTVAKVIASAVKDFDSNLVLVGLAGSHSLSEAKAIGLTTLSEVFADRTYQYDGSLTPRNHPQALLEDEQAAIKQVLQMVNEGTVNSLSGIKVPVLAETICIHGDGPHAVSFAKGIKQIFNPS